MKKKHKKLLHNLKITAVIIALVIAALGVTYFVQSLGNRVSGELTVEQAQELVDSTLAELPNSVSTGAKYIEENSTVTVKSVSAGNRKDLILECSYETMNVASVVENNLENYLTDVYGYYMERTENGMKTGGSNIKLFIAERIKADLEAGETLSGDITLYLYNTTGDVFDLYLSDEVVNTVFGGVLDAIKLISAADKVNYEGEVISITNMNTIRTGIKDCIALNNYSSTEPDTSIPLVKFWNKLKFDFNRNFIVNNQWTYLTNGLLTTLAITACAVLLGILIGFVVAIIRVTNAKTGKLEILSGICKVYLSVMRGTPVMVQLLIIYFVILLPLGVEKFIAAVLCFGLNSGAYVSEIIRGGIMSIDAGQTEAGRSLGFSYIQTMCYMILPQAFKAVLPSLANEFITLLKESSVAFYIGVADLTMGGIKIRSITYSNFMPLIAVALIYLVVVLVLSKGVSILERRLQKGDKR